MIAMIWARFAELQNSILDARITRMIPFLGAALLVAAAGCANCQADSFSLSPSAQGIISRNQLLTPEKAQKALDRARSDFLHRHYESAQKDVRQALEVCPHCALALAFEGILDLHAGNSPEAAEAFHRAIDEDPSSGSAYVGLGIIYNAQGRFRDAIALFDRAAPFSESSWLVHYEAALAHLRLGEYDAGLREISTAGKSAGSDPDRLSGLAYLRGLAQCETGDFDRGSRYFQEAMRRDPNGTFATLARKRLDLLAAAGRRSAGPRTDDRTSPLDLDQVGTATADH